jgi:hypothetical protein
MAVNYGQQLKQWGEIPAEMHFSIRTEGSTQSRSNGSPHQATQGSKVKLALCLTNYREGVWGSGYMDSHFLDLGTSWRWAVSFNAPVVLTPGERAPGTHWIGGWVEPRASLDDVEDRKFLTLQGLKLWPLVRPARSKLLYYQGSAPPKIGTIIVVCLQYVRSYI